MKNKIGIVQGRLSKKVGNKIQAFPKKWQKEFYIANEVGFDGIEFIFDKPSNILLNTKKLNILKKLIEETSTKILSVSCDYSMYQPLYKKNRLKSLELIKKVIITCDELKIPRIGLSFEDNSAILNNKDATNAIEIIRRIGKFAKKFNIIVTLETSLASNNIVSFIKKVGLNNVKINFDLGNSHSLGENTQDIIIELKNYIHSIHVKDRNLLFGGTVPLGTGGVNFVKCFQSLKKINFRGDIIIQGARGKDDVKTAKKYLKFVKNLLIKNHK